MLGAPIEHAGAVFQLAKLERAAWSDLGQSGELSYLHGMENLAWSLCCSHRRVFPGSGLVPEFLSMILDVLGLCETIICLKSMIYCDSVSPWKSSVS